MIYKALEPFIFVIGYIVFDKPHIGSHKHVVCQYPNLVRLGFTNVFGGTVPKQERYNGQDQYFIMPRQDCQGNEEEDEKVSMQHVVVYYNASDICTLHRLLACAHVDRDSLGDNGLGLNTKGRIHLVGPCHDHTNRHHDWIDIAKPDLA